MNTIELINDRYKITCRPGLIEAVKRLPGRQYVRDGRYWTVPSQHARTVTNLRFATISLSWSMEIVYRQGERAAPKLTKKQAYHQRMVQALRRRQYQDWLTAGNDPEIIKLEAKAKELNPDFRPQFTD